MQLSFPISSRCFGGFKSESSATYRILFFPPKLFFKTLIFSLKWLVGSPFLLEVFSHFLFYHLQMKLPSLLQCQEIVVLHQILYYFG